MEEGFRGRDVPKMKAIFPIIPKAMNKQSHSIRKKEINTQSPQPHVPTRPELSKPSMDLMLIDTGDMETW